jgi:hypothetical protein
MAGQQSPDFESAQVLRVRLEDGEDGHSVDFPAWQIAIVRQVQKTPSSHGFARCCFDPSGDKRKHCRRRCGAALLFAVNASDQCGLTVSSNGTAHPASIMQVLSRPSSLRPSPAGRCP